MDDILVKDDERAHMDICHQLTESLIQKIADKESCHDETMRVFASTKSKELALLQKIQSSSISSNFIGKWGMPRITHNAYAEDIYLSSIGQKANYCTSSSTENLLAKLDPIPDSKLIDETKYVIYAQDSLPACLREVDKLYKLYKVKTSVIDKQINTCAIINSMIDAKNNAMMEILVDYKLYQQEHGKDRYYTLAGDALKTLKVACISAELYIDANDPNALLVENTGCVQESCEHIFNLRTMSDN